MKRAIVLTLLALMFVTQSARSAALEGDFNLYDPSGLPITPPGLHTITGIVDFANNQLIIDEFNFLGLPLTTTVLEILGPGSYTRVHNGVTVTATVDPGDVGAYMILSWAFEELPTFMAWEPNPDNTIFTAKDVDGDGVPGMRIPSGPFTGFSAVYEFTAEPTGPGVRLSLAVDGGNLQECASHDGTDVTINAIPQLFGGASLASISWTIDGEDGGTGLMVTRTLALGGHSIEAVATTTTGETGSASTIVTVRDTVRPDLQIAFIDNRGQEVDTAGPGPIQVSMTAIDTCDPLPVISDSTATPSYGVSNGEVLHINASKGNLKLPTTRLRIDATASDSSGNATSSSATLNLE